MKRKNIVLDHGSGGKLSHELIMEMILPVFQNATLSELHDGAALDIHGKRIAFSTDTFVVDPIFFPGGNIGDLAINGTVNDLAMCGAVPLFISVAFILEEGFSISDLEKITKSMAGAAEKAGVTVVTGDTKVVPRGVADKIFINTSGIGLIPENVFISSTRAKPGDKIILSGTIADHGMTILTQREGLSFESELKSDTTALNHMVRKMLSISTDIHVLRDPTRGGVGTALNEIAEKSNVGITIYEAHIPLKKNVAGLCELLGFDPLYVANEGKLLAFVKPEHADALVCAMKEYPCGTDACIIGDVFADTSPKVLLNTRIGGKRIIDMLTGEQLPRIC